jgi:transcriptional regulator with XRE-family HTH domain
MMHLRESQANRRIDVTKLAKLRQRIGMSQADLCRATGIMQSNLSRYETGKLPRAYSTLKKLATALGVTVEELIK